MMAEKMEVKIIAREVVKPSCPTPTHLRRFNLSLVDQMAEHSLVPFLFFYSANGEMNFPEKCRHLKSSLSRTLSLFYPIAGRIRDHCSIDCCDDGAEFVEAELNCPMNHFLVSSPHPDLVSPLVPVNIDPTDHVVVNRKIEFMCLVQTTLFACGGVAICVCLSHKICDGVTYMSFMQKWATIARESDSGRRVEFADLSLASVLPPNPDLESPSYSDEVSGGKSYKTLTRRLFFSASKLEELKGRVSSSAVDKPTRVEAVMGLIWKCAVAAKGLASSTTTVQHSALGIAANLRERLVALVSKNTVGNLLGLVVATSPSTKHGLNIPNYVTALRRQKDSFNRRLERIDTGKDIMPLVWFEAVNEIVSKIEMDRLYIITSICGLPIYLDFGWGRPKLVMPVLFLKNMVMLTDTEDLRGIQACVTLEEQEMNYFEKDEDLLSFANSVHVPLNYGTGKSGPKSKL